MKSKNETIRPDKELAAVCGLFCPACIIYIGARESKERREAIACSMGLETGALRCDGCRAEKRFSYCSTCQIVACAQGRGIDFCGSCDDYPCALLKEFQNAYPHRLELWENLDRIAAAGWETWFNETLERFSCPSCGTLNSAYHLVCRSCGKRPGSAFAAAHHGKIAAHQRARSLATKKGVSPSTKPRPKK